MENKKHILFISSWYPNRTNPTHGIFNRYFAEAAALHNKVSVLHVCSDEHMSSDLELVWSEDAAMSTLVVYYKKVPAGLPGLTQLQKRKRLLAAFETGYQALVEKHDSPDLIQLNVIMPAGIGVKYLSEKYHIPYLINEGWSGYCPEDGNYKGFVQKLLTRQIVRDAKVIMPVSDYLKNAMLAHGLTGHYEVVPNVVDIHVFVPKPKQASNITRYIHISTLDDVQKNVRGIIRAFAMAYEASKDLELVIVGEGIEKTDLQSLVMQLGISHAVTFKGRLSIEHIVYEINAADALVMFSNYETFSLVVAEAFACGKPVITSRAGGLTDVVTPDLGISIEKKNEEQLTEALVHFSKNKGHYDPAHIRQFITERYSKEKIGAQLNQIYEEILMVDKTMNHSKA